MPTDTQRKTLVEHAWWTISNNVHIGYPGEGNSRPFRPMHWLGQSQHGLAKLFAAGDMWYPDCSAYYTWLCKWSGMKDPNGNGFDGLGSSGTMFSRMHGHYTNPSSAHEGAALVFGDGGSAHVCCVIVPGRNPTLASHGSARGPIAVSFTAECAAHPGQPYTFLDISSI